MSNLTSNGPLLLGGFMGTGKSTIGPIVASLANVPFVDLDAVLQQVAGKTIADIFRTEGEAAFRALEAQQLRSMLADTSPRVIALGGGALVDPDLRAEALQRGCVVNLVAEPSTVAERLLPAVAAQPSGRPLLDGASDPLDRIRKLNASRAQVYADAHARIRVDGRAPDVVAHAVFQSWQGRNLLVRSASTTYAARITRDVPTALVEHLRALAPSSVCVVTDETVDNLHTAATLQALRDAGISLACKVVLTPGEPHKQWPAVQRILDDLLRHHADRNSVVVAVGGGVVSDIAGFAAAIFLRGIRWVALPTTMLSMVDAAVGGKTAVDLGLAKNVVGAFHHPTAVLVDPSFTHTETDRAYRSGLAEVIKSGAIADPELLEFMHSNLERVLSRDVDVVEEMIHRSLGVKVRIVSRDERESGERMLLNFGHTLGHGFEAAGNFDELTHGEAIALGMVAIMQLGIARGITSMDVANLIEGRLAEVGLPTQWDRQMMDRALELITFDKKRLASDMRLVMLERVGQPRIDLVPLADVRAYFANDGTKRTE